ncbi:hypothetical protein Tco_1130337, partial [Tanacetum coccineum]
MMESVSIDRWLTDSRRPSLKKQAGIWVETMKENQRQKYEKVKRSSEGWSISADDISMCHQGTLDKVKQPLMKALLAFIEDQPSNKRIKRKTKSDLDVYAQRLVRFEARGLVRFEARGFWSETMGLAGFWYALRPEVWYALRPEIWYALKSQNEAKPETL